MKNKLGALMAIASLMATPFEAPALQMTRNHQEAAIISQRPSVRHKKKKGLLATGDESPNAPEYDRLQFWRHTKRTSYRTIQRTAAKKKKQTAKAPK